MNWEEAVIGTALADPKTMAEAAELIPSDFTGINKLVWGHVLALNSRNALEPTALLNTLKSSTDWFDPISPEDYIAKVSQNSGTAMGEYVDQVLHNSIRKAIKMSAALIAVEANNNTKNTEELIEFAEKQILTLRRNRMNNGVTIGDLIGLFIPRMEGLRNGTIKPAWVPNVEAMKQVIEFAENTEFMIVAARPGEGKSSYLRYEAYKHAVRGGHPIIFNLENDPLEYARAFIALRTGLDGKKLKNPSSLTEQELDIVKASAQELSSMPLRIITMGGPSIGQISQTARRKISEENADLIMLDYIQLVNNGSDKKNEDVSRTTSGLRALGLQMNIPIIAASQLSRDIEKRGTASEPLLSDLRDSGSLEQDATIVSFIRSAWNNPTPETIRIFPENVDPQTRQTLPRLRAIPIRFHVEKNRGGEAGVSSPVKWDKSNGRFFTLDQSVRI